MPKISQFQRHIIKPLPTIYKPSIQSIYIPPNTIDSSLFLRRSGIVQEKALSHRCLIIPDSPLPEIPPMASNLYEETLQEINLVPKPHPDSSIKCTPTLEKCNIPLPDVYGNPSTTVSNQAPSYSTHQNSSTSNISLASYFGKTSVMSQQTAITLP
ncbi:hypothetical protein O181_060949 [Austropuccinia psidii MF-1]|uniref:Uncharacterized protein n=1 Tax=Austropuccinia psidii MF-1 TaxID=1389203 RepID=A0A9Q3EH76_9BASI|nr:hypothetical protein [Austropuccinia psidii MF-1]